MSLYLFLDMYLHSGEYHVGTVGIDIRNYIFTVPLWFTFILGKWNERHCILGAAVESDIQSKPRR